MNLWSRFQSLFANNHLIMVGECVAGEFGRCTIQWPGGGQITAQGAGTIGQRYFVYQRDDGSWRLDGEAPNLSLLMIEL